MQEMVLGQILPRFVIITNSDIIVINNIKDKPYYKAFFNPCPAEPGYTLPLQTV